MRSYFQSQIRHDPKTRELVSQIADFEVIRTDTATEALILENELIKRHWPRYNIRLKDNSTYPYLKITNEEWPRVISTRRILKDGARYYGPYTSAGKAYETLNLLNRLFPYRKCDRRSPATSRSVSTSTCSSAPRPASRPSTTTTTWPPSTPPLSS